MTVADHDRAPRLVVGADASTESEAALAIALDLTARLAGRLLVVHAAGLLEKGGYAAPPDLESMVERARRRRPEAADVPVDVLVEDGPAGDVVVRVAERIRADLLVVGSRGLGAAIRPLGSVSEWVIIHSPVPVVVVPHPVAAAQQTASTPTEDRETTRQS